MDVIPSDSLSIAIDSRSSKRQQHRPDGKRKKTDTTDHPLVFVDKQGDKASSSREDKKRKRHHKADDTNNDKDNDNDNADNADEDEKFESITEAFKPDPESKKSKKRKSIKDKSPDSNGVERSNRESDKEKSAELTSTSISNSKSTNTANNKTEKNVAAGSHSSSIKTNNDSLGDAVGEVKKKRTRRRKSKRSITEEGAEEGKPTVQMATSKESERIESASYEENGEQENAFHNNSTSTSNKRYLLFVGNLPYRITQAELQKIFAPMHPTSIRLITDNTNNKPKGYAFVDFEDADSLQRALKLHHSKVDGRSINVELTAGGGGKGQARKQRIEEKNKKLTEERKDAQEKKRKKKEEEEKENKIKTDAQTTETEGRTAAGSAEQSHHLLSSPSSLSLPTAKVRAKAGQTDTDIKMKVIK